MPINSVEADFCNDGIRFDLKGTGVTLLFVSEGLVRQSGADAPSYN